MTRTNNGPRFKRRPAALSSGSTYEADKALAIEHERRKVGELSIADLNVPDTIVRIARLEQMIIEYMRMTCNMKARRAKDKDESCPSARSDSPLPESDGGSEGPHP
ncbi:hypothetical protein [Anaeroselena agilis]|uniref:Uncharacterized protein n=1 Tax=Anaeroselena agilis TaxID=3063788 RepID=A0ABU3NVW7_9FIRM|nr:hypothetical protein [Selenomonadales bacterium 4137-cl]